ncbi:hypothetical protein VB780_11795 [Leptolyngbya sp. CCNP1308]|uniref:hypothetical protein n=1 Tax=Leptolyngbya sp. CCNP1308 TaxID=3110255 RepID=UPI002B1EAAFA|nr:hypothetical protein [Leptolyngbya sp. CCNP1308]MEA5449256.1 hypothetical protein [Leptolyngbya sp. CCNP1308]
MNKFSGWEFMLNGDTQEFRQLATKPRSYYFNIYGGVDHWLDCPNDDFRMTTFYCDNETDSRVVWQIGHELISLFNGASILFDKNHRKASVYKLLYQGNSVDFVPREGVSALLGKPLVHQHLIDESLRNGASSSIKFPLIHLATEKKDVYFILKYLDMEGSWTTYYKLMEAVETFAAQKHIYLGTVRAVKIAFTNTANNFSLSGFDSRHGFKEITKQNNTKSMLLNEGYEFVTYMAKIYLKEAYFNK